MATVGPYLHKKTGTRSWVKLHPQDDLVGLPRPYLSDPDNFIPKVHKDTNQFETWGIDDCEDGLQLTSNGTPAIFMRSMTVGQLYNVSNLPIPQRQFIKRLIAKKTAQLAAKDKSQNAGCDLILWLYMHDVLDAKGQAKIWRRFKVSNAMRLDILQDKILRPLMGWARNFHVGFYTDRTDGTLLGPVETGHLETSHMNMSFYEFMDERKYTLADFLTKPGDSLGWLYDLGDQWSHELALEKVVPASESDGKFELFGGACACPAEDMKGSMRWSSTLEDLKKPQLRTRIMNNIRTSMNYRMEPATTQPGWKFDPNKLDFQATLKRVQVALGSFSSEPFGPKSYGYSNSFGGQTFGLASLMCAPVDSTFRGHIPGSKEIIQELPDGSRIFEYIRFIEPADMQICECGKPTDLQRCSRCKNRSYCSKECQKKFWKTHKEICKTTPMN